MVGSFANGGRSEAGSVVAPKNFFLKFRTSLRRRSTNLNFNQKSFFGRLKGFAAAAVRETH